MTETTVGRVTSIQTAISALATAAETAAENCDHMAALDFAKAAEALGRLVSVV